MFQVMTSFSFPNRRLSDLEAIFSQILSKQRKIFPQILFDSYVTQDTVTQVQPIAKSLYTKWRISLHKIVMFFFVNSI